MIEEGGPELVLWEEIDDQKLTQGTLLDFNDFTI